MNKKFLLFLLLIALSFQPSIPAVSVLPRVKYAFAMLRNPVQLCKTYPKTVAGCLIAPVVALYGLGVYCNIGYAYRDIDEIIKHNTLDLEKITIVKKIVSQHKWDVLKKVWFNPRIDSSVIIKSIQTSLTNHVKREVDKKCREQLSSVDFNDKTNSTKLLYIINAIFANNYISQAAIEQSGQTKYSNIQIFATKKGFESRLISALLPEHYSYNDKLFNGIVEFAVHTFKEDLKE